ncbi:MFS transporter [Thioclava sp. BHET1]|nr:MFS transporter [Thioclava sp. BHET1]
MPPIGVYLRSATVIAVAIAFFAANYTQYFLLSWMPSYLTHVQGLDIKQMSVVTVIPWISGMIGCALGGFISDRLVQRTGNPIFGRKLILVVTLVLTAISLGVVMLVGTTTQAVTLLAFALFLEGMTPVACWAVIQDLVPARRVGGVGGYVHLLSNIAGIVGPSATGFMIQYGGGYSLAFLVAGAVALIGAVAVILFLRSDNRLEPERHPAARPAELL